jgi:DNA-binding NarL/FixJ family response regulator
MAASTRLVIADDHPLFRDALRQAVASVVAGAKIDEAGSFEDLTALLEQDSDVDLILLDLSMPGISGFSGLIYLRAQYPAIPVVIVSTMAPPSAVRLISALPGSSRNASVSRPCAMRSPRL